ncbi:hypothetical protein [Campylobacter geochelonis]|nr:hypothetical protein [Campylobacter geochelonis]
MALKLSINSKLFKLVICALVDCALKRYFATLKKVAYFIPF